MKSFLRKVVFCTCAAYMLFGLAHSTFAITSSEVTIKVLQTFLESKGLLVFPAGDIKGNFGPLTKQALIAYQQSVGLPAQGVFGSLTKAKVAAELNGTPNSSSVSQNVGSSKNITQVELNARLQELSNSLMSKMSQLSTQS